MVGKGSGYSTGSQREEREREREIRGDRDFAPDESQFPRVCRKLMCFHILHKRRKPLTLFPKNSYKYSYHGRFNLS